MKNLKTDSGKAEDGKTFQRKTRINSIGMVEVFVRMDGKIAEGCGYTQGEATIVALNSLKEVMGK